MMMCRGAAATDYQTSTAISTMPIARKTAFSNAIMHRRESHIRIRVRFRLSRFGRVMSRVAQADQTVWRGSAGRQC